jgi:hypothetical protein
MHIDIHIYMSMYIGAYYYTNGNLYTGEWKDDKMYGRGTYVFINGSKFTGTFVGMRLNIM